PGDRERRLRLRQVNLGGGEAAYAPRVRRAWMVGSLGALCCLSGSAAAAPPCAPGQPCWPSPAEWRELSARVGGRLEQPTSMLAPCARDAKSAACEKRIEQIRSPYWIEDQVSGTQSLGWLDAWTPKPSAWAVAASRA